MKLALFLSSKGFVGKWFSSGRDQLSQPKKYMDYIINNSFLQYLIGSGDKLKESVVFLNGGELTLTNLTELNARSSRADYLVYDEESQAEVAAYRAGVSILSSSELGFIFHISTPVKGSIFEENYERLKLREIKTGEQFIFSRRWDEAGFLAKKREWYEEQKRILPDWYYKQEHCAEFTLPQGAVFQNVEFGKYPDWLMEAIKDQPLLSGIDWNPVSGHKLVSKKWTKDLLNSVVLGEVDLGQGYAVEMTKKQWNIIREKASHGNHLNYECSGINEEYVKWVQKMKSDTRFNWPDQNWHSEEWDSQGVNKQRIVNYIIQRGVCIWVDEFKFPDTAKEIKDCRWDPESEKPKLLKKAASSPHYLESYLHAASEENRRDTTFTFEEWY